MVDSSGAQWILPVPETTEQIVAALEVQQFTKEIVEVVRLISGVRSMRRGGDRGYSDWSDEGHSAGAGGKESWSRLWICQLRTS